MIIDAHQHVWTRDRADYGWIPRGSVLDRDFGEDDVLPALRACGVDGVVLVQAADDPRDTELMFEVAEQHPEVVGVVAFLPLERPADAAVALDALLMTPGFVGVRSLIHDRADPRFLERPEVDETLGMLDAAGVPFDLVADRPEHLALLPGLGERHPGLEIVIDHLAKPPIGAAGPWAEGEWDRTMAVAAENPRVHAKVSGLYAQGPEAGAWSVDGIRPFVDRALELFGSARLMYGGDWPVSLTAGGYERVFSGIAEALGDLDDRARAEVLGGTATRFYGLDIAAQTAGLGGDA